MSGGDLSAFADVYARSLGGTPVPVVTHFDRPLPLPSPTVVRYDATPAAASADMGITIAAAPAQDGVSRQLVRLINESPPDAIALDCGSAELAAHVLYTFSLSCAVGLPMQFSVTMRETGAACFGGALYPGSVTQTLVIESWLRRIPLFWLSGDPRSEWSAPAQYPRTVYAASRIVDIGRCLSAPGRRPRLLVVISNEELMSIDEWQQAISQPPSSAQYVPEDDSTAQQTLVGDTVDDGGDFEPTAAQERFAAALQSYVKEQGDRQLADPEARTLIAAIARRTRSHPGISRGVGVRGTIAFDEVFEGICLLRGAATANCIARAAMVALPPRLAARNKGDEAAIVSEIVAEELYGIRLSGNGGRTHFITGLPADAGLPGATCPPGTPARQDMESAQIERFAVVAEAGESPIDAGGFGHFDLSDADPQGQYPSIKKALSSLLGDLDEQLRQGKITPDEYQRQKAAIMARLRKAARASLRVSDRELATTIVEMMDAQDRQWNSEISFDRMHVYYHVKGTCESTDLSPLKQDYHALKWLIDDMQTMQILKTVGGAGYSLTGLALDIVLDRLIDRTVNGNGTRYAPGRGRVLTTHRGHEIRRYSVADRFRDLSVRHTLKEVAKRRKRLAQVNRTDLRVLVRERRRPQSDIVLCIDASGSMGFSQKLTYARLTAAGIVRAALHDGDRVGVVAFNDRSQTTVPLTATDEASLLDGIACLSAGGNTNIGDGIRAARELLLKDRSRNPKYVILISDGMPSAISEDTFARLSANKARDLTEEAALSETRQAAAAGVPVSVIYIAPDLGAGDLFVKNLARVGRGRVQRVAGLADLRSMLRD